MRVGAAIILNSHKTFSRHSGSYPHLDSRDSPAACSCSIVDETERLAYKKSVFKKRSSGPNVRMRDRRKCLRYDSASRKNLFF